MAFQDRVRRRAAERTRAGEQLERDDPGRVDVRARVDDLTLRLLGER